MDIVKSSISCKIENLINKNIEINIKNICRDISVDYDKCENLVKSYLFFINKPVLELTEYKFPNKSYFIDKQRRVYSKIGNDYKLVGIFKKQIKQIILFE